MSSIRHLRQYNGKPPKAEITYNYKSMEQIKSFQKPNACKFIAFKLLSESVPLSTIPIDLVQMNLFYRENFDEHPSVIFAKFCKFHDLNESEALEHYKWSRNLNNDVNSVKYTKKKHSTAEGFVYIELSNFCKN